MTGLDALNGLKKFLQEEIADQMKFQKENSNPAEYVHPYVSLITLPHKNFMPVGFQVPFILVGFANGIQQDNEQTISIRLLLATYGGQMIPDVNIPDETGYIDLINLIERTVEKLVQNTVIEGVGTVSQPINYGIYDNEVTYPYWYGYVQFDITIPNYEYPMPEF